MITTKVPPPPTIKLEPHVTVEAPKVTLSPDIHVAPSQAQVVVQSIPAPKVEVQVQPGAPKSWVFDIERDKEGNISRVVANPQ